MPEPIDRQKILDENDILLFCDEAPPPGSPAGADSSWKVLIVDDEEEVHRMTRRVLKEFSFEGRKLELLHAYSGKAARDYLSKHPDIALILLDVVMETDDAGLKVARYIRDELKNSIVQIILRTGQAGQEPEHQIIARYNINDYKSKVELTAQKLFTTLTASLRTYRLERSLKAELSERKEMERVIRESEARFRDISHSMADLIWEVDNTRTFTFTSGNVKKTLGFAPEELLGRSFFSLVDGDERERGGKAFGKFVLSAAPIVDEESLVRAKDGRKVRILTNGVPILDSAGKVTGYRGISKDITSWKKAAEEKEQLEEQLRQSQKMESIGTLAGGIAHDFNNILGAIIGYSQLALYDLPEGAHAKKSIDQVLKAGNRAKNLVKQILAISRQTTHEKQPLSIQPIVNEVVSLMRASIPTTVKISKVFQPETGPIHGDPTQIHQVLMNLCTNAAHAMAEKGGELSIDLAEVVLEKRPAALPPDLSPGPHIRVTIADTGHGMDEATRNLIFDPYFTTKEKGIGTGIGLSVVHGIVKGHGGAITCESKVGSGTRFHVFFPRIMIDAARDTETFPPIEMGKERILFVDDEEMLADLGELMLKRLGYRVVTMTDARQALKMFMDNPDRFDMVITDMTMPNLTGAELAERILAKRPGIPVILCTGYTNLITPEKAKAMGIREFLTKPLTAVELASSIRKAAEWHA